MERPLAARHRISNVVSKKVCVLEIDLEITKALPDKAHKRKRGGISKSPDIFAPGDGTRLDTMPLYDCRAYADTTVGIFVGIYETLSLDWHIQPRDMNSVGDQPSFQTLPRDLPALTPNTRLAPIAM